MNIPNRRFPRLRRESVSNIYKNHQLLTSIYFLTLFAPCSISNMEREVHYPAILYIIVVEYSVCLS